MTSRYLIRNATVVSMDPKIGVQSSCDVLIEGSIIKDVGPNLEVASDATIIDGTDSIICPGFIDTHRHMWQTQLAGIMSNSVLLEYFGYIRTVYGSCYTAHDAYLGNYCGALQCIDNGTTFVVDHSHIMNSPEHADSAVKGLLDANIRGVFCYGFYPNPKPTWAELDTGMKPQSEPEWRLEDSKRVKDQFFPANDPTTLLRFGVAGTEYEVVTVEQGIEEISHARSLGSAMFTSHVALGRIDFGLRTVRNLNEQGVLDKDLLFSHGAALQADELEAIKKCGCGLSATPDTELQMAMGPPGPFAFREAGIRRVGLGTDVSCSNPPDMFAQMHLLLQSERHARSMAHKGGAPWEIPVRCEEALDFATMGGARAVGMEDYIGSITPGKRADLLIVKTDSPRMTPISDPIAALVLYANASAVDTVFVDGKIVKQDGKLAGVDWPKVRRELLDSTKDVLERGSGADFKQIMEGARALAEAQLTRAG